MVSRQKNLASIVFAGTMSLYGCGDYGISQEGVDRFAEFPTQRTVEVTDNYINIHQLLKEGKYDEAQKSLEGYLRNEVKGMAEYRGGINGIDHVSTSAKEKVSKTIDVQVSKIENHLKK